jgi:hypothetical protein
MKSFAMLLSRLTGRPNVTGRPPKASTIADLVPLPRPIQTRNPTRQKLTPLPPLPKAR